jgi:uncharacterized protein YbjT (DUF2867 family)
VVNVLDVLDGRRRIVLLSSIFVTRCDHYFNVQGQALDWKRRAERAGRRSGAPYTIVRPGWLDDGEAGDSCGSSRAHTGEGGIGCQAVGALLVEALLDDAALEKTFEVFAGPGAANSDFSALFDQAEPDRRAPSTA